MSYPTDRQYTTEHEWLQLQDDTATVGITTYATQELGDVVYIDLPQPGQTVAAGATCGEVESTKSVSDLYSPVSGTIDSVNTQLQDQPELVNSDPYGAGWLFTVTVTSVGPVLSADDYAQATKA